MLSFVNHHRTLAMTASVIVLLLAVFVNIYLITAPNSSGGPDDPAISAYEINTSLPGADVDITASSPAPTFLGLGLSTQRLAIIGATVGLSIVFVIAIIIVARIMAKKQAQQEVVFKDQLNRLGQIFEAYKLAKGTYPLSSTYSPEHYSGIHMGDEWRSYHLPSDQEMVGLAADWPVVDPSKLKTLLYYPKEAGASFALYARLESLSKEESRDYNMEDNLPKAWGEFNYKVVSGANAPASPPPGPSPESQSADQGEAEQPVTEQSVANKDTQDKVV